MDEESQEPKAENQEQIEPFIPNSQPVTPWQDLLDWVKQTNAAAEDIRKENEAKVDCFLQSRREAFPGGYTFTFKVHRTRIDVEFDIKQNSAWVTCVLRKHTHGIPFMGAAIMNPEDHWDFDMGRNLALKRAAQAMAVSALVEYDRRLIDYVKYPYFWEFLRFHGHDVNILTETIESSFRRELWLCTAPLEEVKAALLKIIKNQPNYLDTL